VVMILLLLMMMLVLMIFCWWWLLFMLLMTDYCVIHSLSDDDGDILMTHYSLFGIPTMHSDWWSVEGILSEWWWWWWWYSLKLMMMMQYWSIRDIVIGKPVDTGYYKYFSFSEYLTLTYSEVFSAWYKLTDIVMVFN
jgi:hypothetical protein